MFRRKRKLYLVFEYVDHTILEELEENPSGLGEETARKHVFQVVRAINFCHQNNVSIFGVESGLLDNYRYDWMSEFNLKSVFSSV